MNKTTILTIILMVLVVVSAVQAFQLTSLKAKIESNELSTKTKSSTPAVQSSGGGITTPKSLDNLPKMVGGC